jgi:hypothetical protein
MHGLFLTLVTLLLLVVVIAYVILAERKGSSDRKIRVVASWSIVVLALLLLVGVNVTCAYERTQVRIVYIVLFLLLLYNAFTDQFMDESLLNMSVQLKSKLVAIIAVGFMAYAIARTRVWMMCNAHLDAVQAVYRDELAFYASPGSSPSMAPSGSPSMAPSGSPSMTFTQQPAHSFVEVVEVQSLPVPPRASPTTLSREQRVDLMEAIIKSAGFRPKQIRRMMRSQAKSKSRSRK